MTKTKPPTDDVRLRRYFCESGASFGFSSRYSIIESILHSGVTSHGDPDSDGSIVRRGVVKLSHERGARSAAQDERGTRALLAKLEPMTVSILFLAYGPESAVPGLSLPDDPQARARLGTHLGQWRNVLIASETAQVAWRWWQQVTGRRDELPAFLLHTASKHVLREARREAAELVSEAWNEWADARGRTQRAPRGWKFERGETT